MKHEEYDRHLRWHLDHNEPADYNDVRSITIRRTKIEQWVDEPFFRHTIKDLLVKVGNGKKHMLAQVKHVLPKMEDQKSGEQEDDNVQ